MSFRLATLGLFVLVAASAAVELSPPTPLPRRKRPRVSSSGGLGAGRPARRDPPGVLVRPHGRAEEGRRVRHRGRRPRRAARLVPEGVPGRPAASTTASTPSARPTTSRCRAGAAVGADPLAGRKPASRCRRRAGREGVPEGLHRARPSPNTRPTRPTDADGWTEVADTYRRPGEGDPGGRRAAPAVGAERPGRVGRRLARRGAAAAGPRRSGWPTVHFRPGGQVAGRPTARSTRRSSPRPRSRRPTSSCSARR